MLLPPLCSSGRGRISGIEFYATVADSLGPGFTALSNLDIPVGAKAAKGDKLTIDVLVLSVAGHRLCCLLTNRIRIMQRMVRPNSLVRWLA